MASLSAWAYSKRQWWLTDAIDAIKGSGYSEDKFKYEIKIPHDKKEQERYDALVKKSREADEKWQ